MSDALPEYANSPPNGGEYTEKSTHASGICRSTSTQSP